MKILYIGGTGEISFDCIHESVGLGHDVSVYNRGNNNAGLPDACTFITGDVTDDASYGKLAGQGFDVVCQFRLFDESALKRDIDLFAGHCGQYVFISSASAYQSPPKVLPIKEDTPLDNPYWGYSRAKAAMEQLLQSQDGLPFTIVRPSHTYRTHMPATAIGGDTNLSRLLRGRSVVVHGDGESLWTITHAIDFARPFARLLGNDKAIGEAVHITHDRSWRWDDLLSAAAEALGVDQYEVVHVPSDTLVRYSPDWEGPLFGDKSPSVIFDNSKARSIAGEFACTVDPWAGMKRVVERHPIDPAKFDPELDALLDRIAGDQISLGG
jgi:uncharacterized protein YbjT (DUF2867 family)